MSLQALQRARAAAKKDCPECYGDGVVTLESNNNPATQRDVRCECTRDPENDDHWPEGDPSHGDRWPG